MDERGERNSGWERVRTRRERKATKRERVREGPRQSSTGNRNGHQYSYTRGNWRDHVDVVSYYFTRFPENAAETDLWYLFKKLGDLREVFISKRRNRNGRRYDFVRFKGVEDVHSLERKLDNIIFGGLKMYVNIPKFDRNKLGMSQQAVQGRAMGEQKEDHRGRYLRMKPEMNVGVKGRSYAEAVTRNLQTTAQRGSSSKDDGIYYRSRSTVYLDIPATGQKWLKEAWVGRLNNVALYDRVEELPWEIAATTSPKYIGDDMVLLLGLTDDQARNLMEEQIEGQDPIFYSMEKWNSRMRPGHRLIWVRCWGIPLMMWDTQHIKKIIAGVGDMVDVEDDVENLRQLDVIRVLIKTSCSPLINHTVSVHMQGEIFNVHIVEESVSLADPPYCRRGKEDSSSEEVLLEESYMASPRSVTAPPLYLQAMAADPKPTADNTASSPTVMTRDSARRSSDIGGHALLSGGTAKKDYPTGKACTRGNTHLSRSRIESHA